MNEILGFIIKSVLTSTVSDENDDNINDLERNSAMKNKLLNRLLQRVHDKQAFCRTNVLGVLGNLCQDNVIPKEFLVLILSRAIERIKDVSAHVRKKAIQLIIILVGIFHVIFAKSQGRAEFLGREEIQKELEFSKQEMTDLREELKQLEEKMRQIGVEDSDEFDRLQISHTSMKKRILNLVQTQEKLKEYYDIVVAFEKVTPSVIFFFF